MKLGRDTGSVVNHIYSRSSLTPEVGMGATILSWSDRSACTVIGWNGRLLTVQKDRAIRTDKNGMSECQTYQYERDPDGAIYTFKLTSKGWVKVWFNQDTQRWNTVGKGGITVGTRETYYDYTF
jgi:hypothetical protein